MSQNKDKVIAVFDFDGTITTKDTLFDFIKFYYGSASLIMGIFSILPILIAFKLRILPNEIAKQEFLYHFFAQKKYDEFKEKCNAYKERINNILRPKTMEKIKYHQNEEHKVIIISASIEDWILPWAKSMNIHEVYGTKLEIIDNTITGKLASKNCRGEEKVKRLLEIYPDRANYTLYMYGDSSGDKDILAIADHPFYRNF